MIMRAIRRWRHARNARYWGLPAGYDDEDTQTFVTARLRCDAIRSFGLTETQWREFVDAHQATAGGVS